jgi:pimeloyl-ACP methyl ester carboxylesterase
MPRLRSAEQGRWRGPGRLEGIKGESVRDVTVEALGALVPDGVRRGELARDAGRTLRWVEAGAGGPTVVLDAAGGTPALTWAPVLPALAEHTRVVAYDRAGIGASDPVASPLTVRSQVEDLTALLAEVAGDAPCVLVGNSWGGQLAQLAAWEAPERVAGLVLLDPAHEEFEPWVGRVIEAAFVRFFALRLALGLADGALRGMAEENARCATGDPRSRELLVEAELACCARREHPRAVRAESRMITAHASAIRRLRAAAPPSSVPVTVLSATTGMPKGLRARATALHAEVAAGAPHGRHTEVPGAGHYVHRSRPEVVTEAVLDVAGLARQGR